VKFTDLFRRKPKKGNPRKHRARTAPLPATMDVSTAPLPEQQIQNALARSLRIAPQQIVFGCGQSIGKQRDHNEDSLVAFTITIGSEGNSYPLGLFVIADGMGGHQYGEIASATAARTLAGYLLRKFHPTIADGSQTMDEPLQDVMRAAITEAQHAVLKAAPGSGTTLTAVLVLGQQMTIGHVGDSRAYAIRANGRTEAITRDHSLVKRLEELGQLTPSEAAAHPQRNVLYRALGQGEILEPDIFTTQFPQPGYLMLCSDGLWSVVPDEHFAHLINEAPNLTSACQKLVAAANDAGGPDNISAVLVQLLG
jgi:serine/threonine protein phosphatase PrpC